MPLYTPNSTPKLEITLLTFQNPRYKLALNKCTSTRRTNTSGAICRGAKKVRMIGVRDHVHASHLESNINIPCPLRYLAMRDDWCVSVAVDGNRAWGDVGQQWVRAPVWKTRSSIYRKKKNINSRRIDQLFTALTTTYVYARVSLVMDAHVIFKW